MSNKNENKDSLKYKLIKKAKRGVIKTIIVAGVIVVVSNYVSKKANKSISNLTGGEHHVEEIKPERDDVFVNLDSANMMNVIINNIGVSNSYMNKLSERMEEDGFIFTTTNNCEGIDQIDSMVITLDNCLSSNELPRVLAPYQQNKTTTSLLSDGLSLILDASLNECKIETNNITCGSYNNSNSNGVITFSANEPETEANITCEDTAFSTLTFNEKKYDVDKVANALESAILRYYEYRYELELGSDLITKADNGDAVISSTADKYKVFQKDVHYNSNKLDTKTLKLEN